MREAWHEDWLKGQREFISRLLEHKFGKVSRTKQQRIDSASVDDLLDFAIRLLSAQTLEQVFKK